uniref:Amidase domain-containing protein n=1 Tax=Aegilops tauschii subsp. strangulata TaxID=200361 RepID=A0A453FZ11_AEGTS
SLQLQAVAAVLALVAGAGAAHSFEFHEATVEAIQLGFSNGTLTSTALVRFYLDQIGRLNPLLHAVIEDNIATRDALNTTAGSLALLGSVVKRDAGVAARLRRAGAVVLGKASLSEWANFRPVEAGWSARGGQARNPYVLSSTPCGSSAGSGVAVAANMAAVTLGTETDGSILCPSSFNSVVGIKPTLGLTSRAGVVPITPLQDTVGPMCRTVSDAVHVLDAIVGYDAQDAAATGAASKYIPHGGYTQFLKKNGLKGKRIGVPNGFFQGYDQTQLNTYKQHLATMRKLGAVVIEKLDVAANLTALFVEIYSKEGIAMQAEFKLSINAYLADLVYSPVHSLADIIAFNNKHPVEERLKDFGQPDLIAAQSTNGIGPVERGAIRRLKELNANGLEKLMMERQLDAVVAPNSDISSLLAINGHPGIVVPAGYDEKGFPFGICFGGLQGYEPRLIEMAYSFEQATKVRRPPMFKP